VSATAARRGTAASWLIPLIVAVATFVAFLPVLRAGFVTWDDNRNFTGNPYYRGLGWTQLRWMWTTFLTGHYIPLSWMTLGLDYVLWGMNPAGYHFVNLLLHCGSAVLLYFVARRLFRLAETGKHTSNDGLGVPAAFAALVYAVHPLRVESVAWVTERRDVLSMFFYLMSILLYLRACEDGVGRRRWFSLAVLTFICALLSKATAVTLPAVLLILNAYPLRRIGGRGRWWNEGTRRVALELAPFALLSAATGIVSLLVLHPPSQLSLAEKIAVSGYSLGFYLWKTIAPVDLSPLYEMPRHVDTGAASFVASYVVVIAVTGVAWFVRRRWPGVTTAWVAFLAIIFPLLGVVQNGPQIVADRYTYHAALALAVLAGGVVAYFRRRELDVVCAALLIVLGGLTWRQAGVWHDSETLWSRVLQVDSTSSIGQIAMGDVLIAQNREGEALDHYRRGVALDPDYADGHNNLGVLLARQGNFAEAIDHYQRALAIRPDYPDPQVNWGVALAKQGKSSEAIEHYKLALAQKPDYADAHVNWGNALVRMGNLDEAIAHYRDAVNARPDDADAQLNWGVALAQQKNYAEAILHFEHALAINPDLLEARDYLSQAQRLLERPPANDHPR
jgi:tetratricopeptide (TPR) repeat protein